MKTDVITVETIMTKKLITLHPKNLIEDAALIFKQYNIHHIPIVVMDKLVGIISQGDLLFTQTKVHRIIKAFKESFVLQENTVDQIMTPNPISIDKSMTLKEAAKIMTHKHVNALPITENDRLIGLITSHDLLKLLTK